MQFYLQDEKKEDAVTDTTINPTSSLEPSCWPESSTRDHWCHNKWSKLRKHSCCFFLLLCYKLALPQRLIVPTSQTTVSGSLKMWFLLSSMTFDSISMIPHRSQMLHGLQFDHQLCVGQHTWVSSHRWCLHNRRQKRWFKQQVSGHLKKTNTDIDLVICVCMCDCNEIKWKTFPGNSVTEAAHCSLLVLPNQRWWTAPWT